MTRWQPGCREEKKPTAQLQTRLGNVGFPLPRPPAADQDDFPTCFLPAAAVATEKHTASRTAPLCKQGELQASEQTAHLLWGSKSH